VTECKCEKCPLVRTMGEFLTVARMAAGRACARSQRPARQTRERDALRKAIDVFEKKLVAHILATGGVEATAEAKK